MYTNLRVDSGQAGMLGLIITGCVCLTMSGCGPQGEPIREDDPPSVVALKKAGAIVKREPHMGAPNMTGRSVDLTRTSLDQELFAQLADVPGLVEIKLTGSAITDELLARIPHLKGVNRIDLTGSKVTDEGLKHLESLPSLLTVNLTDTQVTGSGLANLSPKLNSVVLANLPLTDQDLENLQHIKGLSMLILTGTQVTAAGVSKLKEGRPFLLTVGIKLN